MQAAYLNTCCQGRTCQEKILSSVRVHTIYIAVGLAFLALAIYFRHLGQSSSSLRFFAASVPFMALGISLMLYLRCVRCDNPTNRTRFASSGSEELKSLIDNNNIKEEPLSFDDKIKDLGFVVGDLSSSRELKNAPQSIGENLVPVKGLFLTGKANGLKYFALFVLNQGFDEIWVFAENPQKDEGENLLFYNDGVLQTDPFKDPDTLTNIKNKIKETLSTQTIL